MALSCFLTALTCSALLMQSSHALEIPSFRKTPVPTSPWERTYTFDVFRGTQAKIRPVDYKIEALLFGLAIVYVIVHFLGKARNRSIAQAWVQIAQPLLEDEFAYVGKEKEVDGHEPAVGEGRVKLAWNGGSEALAYASGRRGADGLQVLFRLRPYHDAIELLYQVVKDIAMPTPAGTTDEVISLTFMLPYIGPDNISGVFALVDKSHLRATRQGRFDLSFTKVLENENANDQRQLDKRFAIMSEAGELTDALLGEIGDRGSAQRHRIGIQAALNGPAGAYLNSLVLSDQPESRPEDGPIPVSQRVRRLVVTMRLPRSQKEARDSLPLVEAACNIVDALEMSHARLTNTAVAKLRNARVQVDKDLEEEATKWKKEEEEEAKAEAKRKAEKEKYDKLSPAEQEKRRQVEKKRAQKKAQGKAVKAR